MLPALPDIHFGAVSEEEIPVLPEEEEEDEEAVEDDPVRPGRGRPRRRWTGAPPTSPWRS
jgi:hypothetical protein